MHNILIQTYCMHNSLHDAHITMSEVYDLCCHGLIDHVQHCLDMHIDHANSLIHDSTNIKITTCANLSCLSSLTQPSTQPFTTTGLPATALLSELHWLPVNYRITFKLACLTYTLLTTSQTAYLRSAHTTTPLYYYTYCTVD